MELRLLAFNNSTIVLHVVAQFCYGAAVKLEITYIGEVPSANLTLTSITAPSFDFVLKML